MPRKVAIRVLWGILACLVLSLITTAGLHEFLRHGNYRLGIEPRYDGRTLSDWTQHAYHFLGAQRIANADAAEAIQAMFADGRPFLVHWIATPMHSAEGMDVASQALDAFTLLGPNAKAAIPDLIKVIGQNSFPASALARIGTNAVPALIQLLISHQEPDFYGDWRRNIPDNVVRENAILALTFLGTNAQEALPVLMECYKDEKSRSHADMASALAGIGHNQPEIVIPALACLLTNSSDASRFSAPAALASFGRAATPAIPALLAVGQSADERTKATIGVAIKEISPDRPNCLSPLAAILKSEDASLRESAFWELDTLGTNGAETEVLAVMEKLSKQEPRPDLRTRAIDWLAKMDGHTNELLAIARLNLTNENESVACSAVRCLGAMADGSPAIFRELLMACNGQRIKHLETSASDSVYSITLKHPEYLLEDLSSSQPEVVLSAMRFMHSLKETVMVVKRWEPEPSTNFQIYVMPEIVADGREKLQITIPILVRKLHDENKETRQLATNILLELNPKAAQKAGVVVRPPYSFYAD